MKGQGLTRQRILEVAGIQDGGPSADTVQVTVENVSTSGTAEVNSLVFAEDDMSYQAALGSRAGLILARSGLGASQDPRVIHVRDPRLVFAICARELAAGRDEAEPAIHASASVHPSARLGSAVRVGAGAVIEADAVLGDDVFIGPKAVVGEGVRLGDRVVVQAGAVLGSLGFGYVRNGRTGDYVLFPQQGELVIEDDVEIGANTTIDRGALEETRIGRGTKIDNLVHIGHNCRIGKNVIIAAQVGISGSCVIEDGAILAGQVGLSDHCHIGPGVILGGQAGVYRGKRVTGAGEVFSGTPAEPLREQMRSLARLRRLR